MVQFFIDQKRDKDAIIELNPRDRWGGTPLNDAYLRGHNNIIKMLEENGGVRADTEPSTTSSTPSAPALKVDAASSVELIWAASLGDLRAIHHLVARGIPLEAADYDLRTPLHLAAAEGHIEVIEYLLAHGVDANPKDRWGYTPSDDARRHGRDQAASVLQLKGGRRSIEEQNGLDVSQHAEEGFNLTTGTPSAVAGGAEE